MPGNRPDESTEGGNPGSIPPLNGRNRETLAAVFARPTRADIRWKSIETLLRALGGEVSEGRGSRVRVALRGLRATFHEPHPGSNATKGAVEDVREFLHRFGVKP